MNLYRNELSFINIDDSFNLVLFAIIICLRLSSSHILTIVLVRIHTLGHAKRSKEHPDSRAIMFESEVYSKRKIDSFLSVLEGFKSALQVVPLFADVKIKYV